jgi:release factor glutamine methyltransferase
MLTQHESEIAATTSRAEALQRVKAAFAAAAIETPALDARVIMAHALGIDAIELVVRPDVPIGAAAARRLIRATARRLAREPVARIVGQREFWGLPFALAAQTLVPRPETETLVAAVLGSTRQAGRAGDRLRLVDLGTGSGCILIALLRELPQAIGLGLDRSPAASGVARHNARQNGVGGRAAFAVADWADAVAGPFDIVVANPPYVASADLAGLAPEVAWHDPAPALDGGADGLDAVRRIAGALPRMLGRDGLAALEFGAGQADAVGEVLAAAGLQRLAIVPDLAGIARVVTVRRA